MSGIRASRAVRLYGTEVSDARRRELKAGDLTAVLDNGALRYIRYRGIEVLRGIAYLVRDKNWGTYSPEITGLAVSQRPDGFRVTYRATCRDREQAIRYDASIEAGKDGRLKFSATGMPETDFLTNRTGFVVLHPLEGVVGQPVEVVHTDGRREKRRFPKFISPGQPIFEIRSLKHTVTPGVTATVLMEGNKFEMEDHRNWMDASYKTYVCSLLDPWPYTLPKGVAFDQSISVTIDGRPKQRLPRRATSAVPVSIGGPKGRVPLIGTGVPMKEAAAALDQVDLLAAANPAYLVCQIDGRETGQRQAASAFAALKSRTGAPVTLEIILPARASAQEEMQSIAGEVRAGGLKPDRVVVTHVHDLKSFQPTAPRPWGPTFEEMAAAARAAFPATPVGGGMLSYFTELNRKPVPRGLFDFITHTSCPIVHAADDVSVMETLESLPWIFASTRQMIGNTAYHIGPTSIPCRDNPYGAAVAPNPDNGRVCLSDIDPRQRGLFAAAWSLGYAARAATAGIDALAIGSAVGPQGAIYRRADYPQPWFDQGAAQVFPVYHVLAGLSSASGLRALSTQSGDPAAVASLAYATKAGPVLWLANLTAQRQKVKVTGFKGKAELRALTDGNFETLARTPEFLLRKGKELSSTGRIELGPYAVLRMASLR